MWLTTSVVISVCFTCYSCSCRRVCNVHVFDRKQTRPAGVLPQITWVYDPLLRTAHRDSQSRGGRESQGRVSGVPHSSSSVLWLTWILFIRYLKKEFANSSEEKKYVTFREYITGNWLDALQYRVIPLYYNELFYVGLWDNSYGIYNMYYSLLSNIESVSTSSKYISVCNPNRTIDLRSRFTIEKP